MNNQEKIKELVDKLNYYTKLYDEGNPEITDKEWDDMYFKLVSLEKETGIYLLNSPTQKINYQIVNKLNKVKHSHLMLSLDKTKSIDEVKSFIGKREYISMAKMDGLTCSLTYRGGRLVSAETRGNGEIGEDILHNALVVKNIPNKIDYQDELIIDGEIICDYNSFKDFENEYKNPRNFASGSIRLLDNKECEKRKLSFIVWDIITGLTNEKLSLKIEEVQKLGFTTVPFYWGNFVDDDVIETTIENIKIWCKENGYPIDGIVFKYNNCKEYDAAGRTDHHFKGGIAYKFYDEEYETELLDIEWTMGRTGQLTPVAIYKDIDIDGTICNRASLHNISVMEEQLYTPYKGEKIWISKMNMIIPQIVNHLWVANDYKPGENVFYPPEICPICGHPTSIHQDNSSKVLYCDNPACEGKLINIIDHFAGKKGLDIKGISKATIEKLINWGWLGDRQSIFELKEFRNEWIKKPGFGIASVDKILKSIEESRNTTLDKIIAAAGIPEIGSRVAKDLASHYNSWEEFREENNFLQYDGIGDVMNKYLLSYNYTEIDYIVENYLTISENKITINDNNIKDKVFCITGKTHIFKNRVELTADIEAKGGKVVSSMSSKVNYLINNDNTSTTAKNKAAQAAGIPILTEEEYLELVK